MFHQSLYSRQVRTGMDGHGSVTKQVGALSTAIYFALLEGLGTLLRLFAKCGAGQLGCSKLRACMGR